MSKTYKALKPVGRWGVGTIVGDLPQEKINQLLAERVIEEVKPNKTAVVKDKEVKANG